MSRALNDAPHVSEAVRRKVKEAAAALDYHPNLAAQSLIARRSYLIGLTYERPSPSYVVELQRGALDRLSGERYRLIVLPFGVQQKGHFIQAAGVQVLENALHGQVAKHADLGA